MADHEWLKHLAGARRGKDGLSSEDPDAVRRLASTRLDETMNALFEEATEACRVFNEHAASRVDLRRRTVRLLPIAPRPDAGTSSGLLFMLGRVQITLERRGGSLEASIATITGFQRVTKKLHRFTPQVDPFGSLIWCMDNALLMGPELIIKRILEDLLNAACASGDA